MNKESKVIGTNRIAGFQPDPTFTSEEAIVLRSLVAGKIDKQVRNALRMAVLAFHGMIRDLRGKTGTSSNLSLLVWAQRHMKSGDQRVDRQERDGAR